jgi:hypothetical protein
MDRPAFIQVVVPHGEVGSKIIDGKNPQSESMPGGQGKTKDPISPDMLMVLPWALFDTGCKLFKFLFKIHSLCSSIHYVI